MGRQVRSIKGEIVDFDLLEIKQKIGGKPISADVKNRENFVFSKRKRGAKKIIGKMLDNQKTSEKPEEIGKARESGVEVKKDEGSRADKIEQEVKPKPKRIIKKKNRR